MMRVGILVLALFVAACGQPDAGPPADLLIVGVDVLPMTDDVLQSRRTIVVRDGRIAGVLGPDEPAPTAIDTVDGAGLVAMPGLIDTHVHLRSEHALPLYLAHGVTTVRNMNGAFGHPLQWRSEVAAGTRFGPTIFTSSPTIRTDQGEDYAYQIHDSADVSRLVDDAVSQGYDLIKVYQVPAHLLAPLVAVANAHGLEVAGHIPFFASEGSSRAAFLDTLDLTLNAGMSSVEHLGGLVYATGLDDASSDEAVAAVAQRVSASGVAVTPVMAQDLDLAAIVLRGAEAHDPTAMARIERYTGSAGVELLDNQVGALFGSDPWTVAVQSRLLLELHRAGVPLLLGTDSHGPNALGGRATIEEIGNMVAAGLTPYEALRAGTVTAAEYLGRQGEVGVVAEGAVADLVLVPGDPRTEWQMLFRPAGIVLGGRWIPAATLADSLNTALDAGTYCLAPACEDPAGK